MVIRAIFGQVSPKLLASINALYVYACTGQGKAAMKDHATARTCIRLAARDKDYLFTTGDSAKFSNMSTMSEVRIRCKTGLEMHKAQKSVIIVAAIVACIACINEKDSAACKRTSLTWGSGAWHGMTGQGECRSSEDMTRHRQHSRMQTS